MADEKQTIYIEPIDEKYFRLIGPDTKKYKGNIKSMGGRWHAKHQGWLFPVSRRAEIALFTADVLSGDVDPMVETPYAPKPVANLEDITLRIAELEKTCAAILKLVSEP